MNLLLRTLWLLLLGARRRAVSPVLGPCRTPFRVRPLDLDILGHMNNGRYLSLMDLARMDLMVRSGLWKQLRANGFYPVLVAEAIQFRRSLQPWERYEIETTLPGWDERDFFGVQRFIRTNGEVVATAIIRARFLKYDRGMRRAGSIPPAQIVALAGLGPDSPPLPEWITGAFGEVHRQLRDEVGAAAA